MNFDIVFLGSGIACTQTLMQVLAKLGNETAHTKKIKVAVVEKDGEFWRGVAYGKKSSVNSLIITTLAEFIPADEKEIFLEWLLMMPKRVLVNGFIIFQQATVIPRSAATSYYDA